MICKYFHIHYSLILLFLSSLPQNQAVYIWYFEKGLFESRLRSGLSIITENNILHNDTRFFQQLITRQQRIQNKKIWLLTTLLQ